MRSRGIRYAAPFTRVFGTARVTASVSSAHRRRAGVISSSDVGEETASETDYETPEREAESGSTGVSVQVDGLVEDGVEDRVEDRAEDVDDLDDWRPYGGSSIRWVPSAQLRTMVPGTLPPSLSRDVASYARYFLLDVIRDVGALFATRAVADFDRHARSAPTPDDLPDDISEKEQDDGAPSRGSGERRDEDRRDEDDGGRSGGGGGDDGGGDGGDGGDGTGDGDGTGEGGSGVDVAPVIAVGIRKASEDSETVYGGLKTAAAVKTAVFGHKDTPGQRKIALEVLRAVRAEEPVSCAAVAYLAVLPFYELTGNLQAGSIGEHYAVEVRGLLAKPPTDENLRALAERETAFWKSHHGSLGGSLMTAQRRYEILLAARHDWESSLTGDDLERWNDLKGRAS